MANETAGQGDQAQQPQFGIERIYLKDLSLECPKGVEAFGKQWKPRIDLDLNNSQTRIAEDIYEVVLRLTVTAKDADTDESYYLVEIQQAGTFRVRNVGDEELRRALATVAPTTLFPYARETIDSLVNKANFPPLRLSPINFDLLFAQALEKQKQAATDLDSGKETVQ